MSATQDEYDELERIHRKDHDRIRVLEAELERLRDVNLSLVAKRELVEADLADMAVRRDNLAETALRLNADLAAARENVNAALAYMDENVRLAEQVRPPNTIPVSLGWWQGANCLRAHFGLTGGMMLQSPGGREKEADG